MVPRSIGIGSSQILGGAKHVTMAHRPPPPTFYAYEECYSSSPTDVAATLAIEIPCYVVGC